jgi:hypothetical protein
MRSGIRSLKPAIRVLSDEIWFGATGVVALWTTATYELAVAQTRLPGKVAKEQLRAIIRQSFRLASKRKNYSSECVQTGSCELWTIAQPASLYRRWLRGGMAGFTGVLSFEFGDSAGCTFAHQDCDDRTAHHRDG